jgi:FKBP-type peptidyl-prolyl cis-trans isomerase 2
MARGRIKGKQIEDSTIGESKLSFNMYYLHEQPVSVSMWSITHNLNRYVGVDIYNTSNESVEADVEYVNDNTIRIHFNSPTAGKAIIT